MRWKHAWTLLAIVTAGATGCTDRQFPLESDNPLAALEAPGRVNAVQCVMVRPTTHGQQVTYYSPSGLALDLPEAVKDERTGRSMYHVVVTPLAGGGEDAAVACVAPLTFSYSAFHQEVRAVGLPALLQATPMKKVLVFDPGQPAFVAAGNMLMDHFIRPIRQNRRARTVTPEGFAAGLGDDPFRLPAIQVTVYSSQYLVNMSNIYWFLHKYPSWGDQYRLYTVEEYYNDLCPEASEKYITDYAEILNLQADSAEVHEAIGNVASYSCVIQGDGKKMCVDLFIMGKRAFILKGDNRDFSDTAGYHASRAQIYIDFDSLKVKEYINGSITVWNDTFPPFPHKPKDIHLEVVASDTVVLVVELYNGFCTLAGRALCPSIDALIQFSKQSDETWKPTDIRRDGFPSLAIYDQVGIAWHELFREKEGVWTSLYTAGRTLAKRREDLNMPPGCLLQ